MRLPQSSNDASPHPPSVPDDATPATPAQEPNAILDALAVIERNILQRINDIQTQTNSRFDALEARFQQIEQGQRVLEAAGDAKTQSDVGDLHEHLDALKASVDEQLGGVRRMFDRVDDQFNRVDAQFNRIDGQHNRIDGQFNHIDGRLNDLQSTLRF
ncbi:hypothetical protein OE88DRAFT_105456 [Heliocybe sulcata]|uniref:t-SNARE coiled-coil homology domain-containing protein n=1 Tax=Heliocybe sulcata TaxID=5364 RepID=A0A5C3NL34_9AGAM|nr:hypothetical protein OE88DRAFT_105456 [Heliocybe sulcata]